MAPIVPAIAPRARCWAPAAKWQKKLRFTGFFVSGANFPHLLADLLRIEHRAWQRAERARFRRGCYQLPIYGAGHRRLDDRKLDLEQSR
jgi:hypothetical protein